MIAGSFGDFLNSLREFDSGVSTARIEENGSEVIEQVGQDRFDAFENGDLTLVDLQYSSESFLGFVGYQFGEPILIDLGYYEFHSTPGANDFWGKFTGKNGVKRLDDLKTNVQEQVILEEFQLSLDRIETGLMRSGQSLDDFIGRTIEMTDAGGRQVNVELSVTGILAAAHFGGAFGTLDFLQYCVDSADEISTSNVQFIEQFAGFDAPSIAELRANCIEPLVTDATLTIESPFEARMACSNSNQISVPAAVAADSADDGETDSETPALLPELAVAHPSAETVEGLVSLAGAPAGPVTEQIWLFDHDTGKRIVAGTDGVDGSARCANGKGTNVIRHFEVVRDGGDPRTFNDENGLTIELSDVGFSDVRFNQDPDGDGFNLAPLTTDPTFTG